MKSFIVILFALGTATAQPPMGKCGPPPTKMISECCEDLGKLAKPEIFSSCNTECIGSMCCLGTCFAKHMNFLKDGKFDKDTAVAAMNKAFADNPEWHSITDKAVDECMTSIKNIPPPPMPCPTMETTRMMMCLEAKLASHCPKPIASADCDKTRTFLKCLM